MSVLFSTSAFGDHKHDEEKSLLTTRDLEEEGSSILRKSPQRHIISSSRVLRLLICAALLAFTFALYSWLQSQCYWTRPSFGHHDDIACQVQLAEKQYTDMIMSQSRTFEEAIIKYRLRYRREPPKGFEQWVTFALEHNSTIIDDYDVLERNLAPFRRLSGDQLRLRIQSAIDNGKLPALHVSNGTISGASKTARSFFAPIADQLPNFILPFNDIDEPKVVGYSSRPEEASDEVTFIDATHEEGVSNQVSFAACTSAQSTLLPSPNATLYPSSTLRGIEIRSSWLDQSKDICQHPEYRHMHGFFQTPGTFTYTSTLIPIASFSTFSTYGDIIGPPTCYYSGSYKKANSDDVIPFADKLPVLYWRGSTTGMWTTSKNWSKGHRQRMLLLIMRLRATLLGPIKSTSDSSSNEQKQQQDLFDLKSWNFDIRPSSFIQCTGAGCKAQEENLRKGSKDSAEMQYKYKYALDMDGNCMSCRYYRLLQSNAVVFKQSINLEWHDDRLIPWIHFVPLSMKMDELPAVLDFFINDKRGDYYGEKIATSSRIFAESSLRRIDATIYWYRFALEYAQLFEKSKS